MTNGIEKSGLLRHALLGNAAFSGLSGLIMIAFAGSIAAILGPLPPIVLAVIGAGLLIYGVALIASARRGRPKPAEAWIAVVIDSGWILASLLLLVIAPNYLTTLGNMIVAAVAVAVALFAAFQLAGLRRLSG